MNLRIAFLSATTIALSAAEHVAVDRPDDWYRPDVSHHGKHAVGGAVIGAVAYAAGSLVTDSRPKRVALAVAAGAAIGLGYELIEGRDGKSFVDPVDAAWVTVGAAAGATAAFAITPHRDGASAVAAFHF